MNETLIYLWDRLVDISWSLLLVSVFFILLSFILKRRGAIEAGRQSFSETKLNLVYYFTDFLALVPLLVIFAETIRVFLKTNGLIIFTSEFEALPVFAIIFLTVFISDFVSYWRHRLMHTNVLWPAHAVHHSDQKLTWLGLMRFHPINRLIAVALNILVLTVIGFPVWAIAVNALIRHYYGFFIHADLPFTYGPLRYLLVSPRMHRWHHLKEVEGAGSNFATVFSVFDLAFKTFYLPKKEIGPLGVRETDFPTTWLGQLFHPFKVWGKALTPHRALKD